MTRAVKILIKSQMGPVDSFMTERFFHELQVTKSLDHPHILKLYECYEDTKRFYLATELCLGGELYDYLTKHDHCEEADAALMIQQILSAITYCHR